MGDIKEYKIDNPRQRAMLIACDYVKSYQTSHNEPTEDARENFFKSIIQIAKAKSHNIVSFSYFSTDSIKQNQINQVKEILEKEEIKKLMKETNVEVVLGGQYRKRNSENKSKYEDIIDELEDLSYQYSVTDVIAFDDTIIPASKLFFIHEQIFKKFPDINIDYISPTDYFPFYERYKNNEYKLNIYGEFKNKKLSDITSEEARNKKGLGTLGYMSEGLLKLKEKVNSKCENYNKIEEK